MSRIPLMYVEVVAAVEDLRTMQEAVCLCSIVDDRIGLSIRVVEPVPDPPKAEQ